MSRVRPCSAPRRLARLLAGLGLAAALAQLAAAPAGAAPAAPPSRAAARSSPSSPHCPFGVDCLHVRVPLDWSGHTPGSISLNVEVEQGLSKPRGVMFLIAGGPGQAATQVFDVSRFGFWAHILPGYTLVTFDDRGTGSSGPLSCPNEGQHASDARYGAACARLIGQRRAFYSTVANTKDIDAVRRALGYQRISLLGVSYGTDLSLAYAAAFPAHVQRIVLDSVSSSAAWTEVLAQLPGTLREYCLHVCGAVTSDFGSDVVTLANALERHPLRGSVLAPDGGRTPELLTAQDLVYLAVETDLDPGLAAALPAAVQAARHGVAAPLLRLNALVAEASSFGEGLSGNAVYVATVCNDGPFPWQPDTPFVQRPALAGRASAAVASASIGGFGRWALAQRTNICLRWPLTQDSYAPTTSSYPNVPVLVIAGELDVRGTLEQARAVVASFPQARLVTLSNVGHSAITAAPVGCLERVIDRWLAGRTPGSHCASPRALAPLGDYPPVAQGKAWARPVSALALAGETVREAESTWLLSEFEETPPSVGGLVSGRLHDEANSGAFTLSGYGIVDGLELSGKITAVINADNPQPIFSVTVDVKHGGSTLGELTDSGHGFDGILDGRQVVAGRIGGIAVPIRVAPSGAWSNWTPSPGSTAEVAQAIAAHLEGEYRLDSKGARLVRVTAGPAQIREGGRQIRIAEIATVNGAGPLTLSATTNALGQTDVWSFELCGAGPGCTIRPGKPSERRAVLVQREGLELALFTFKFDPRITAVIVTLPGSVSELKPSDALYFKRSELAAELAQPLRATLPLLRPPLPTSADPNEQTTIENDTLPDAYLVGPVVYGQLTLTPYP